MGNVHSEFDLDCESHMHIRLLTCGLTTNEITRHTQDALGDVVFVEILDKDSEIAKGGASLHNCPRAATAECKNSRTFLQHPTLTHCSGEVMVALPLLVNSRKARCPLDNKLKKKRVAFFGSLADCTLRRLAHLQKLVEQWRASRL